MLRCKPLRDIYILFVQIDENTSPIWGSGSLIFSSAPDTLLRNHQIPVKPCLYPPQLTFK